MSILGRFLLGVCILFVGFFADTDPACAGPRKLTESKEAIVTLRFSADGKFLVSAALGGRTRVWDVASGQEKITLDGGNGAAFPLDAKTLAYPTPRQVSFPHLPQ